MSAAKPFLQVEFDFQSKSSRRNRRRKNPQEFKIVSLKEASLKEWLCETPEQAAEYWRSHIATASWYSNDQECTVAILLNTRYRVLGHHLISIGILDQAIIHPREAFRAAILAAAHSIIIGHNHPSGDPTPSQADIAATRDLVRAGEYIRIRVIDHIIMGNPTFTSLKIWG